MCQHTEMYHRIVRLIAYIEDFPLEISQRLICPVGSMGTRVVMQEQHAFGEES
jgi:hypothetical protein